MTLLNSIPVPQSAHLDLLVDFRCGIHVKTLHVTRSQTGFLQDPTRCVLPAWQLSKIPQFPRLLCASIMVTRLTMCLHPFLLKREAVLGSPAANGRHVCVSSPSTPSDAVGWTGPYHFTVSYKTSDKGIHVGLHWPVWACNPSQSPTRKDHVYSLHHRWSGFYSSQIYPTAQSCPWLCLHWTTPRSPLPPRSIRAWCPSGDITQLLYVLKPYDKVCRYLPQLAALLSWAF